MSENKMICHCFGVDSDTIKKAIAEGARTVEDIEKATGAGGGCGVCNCDIEAILEEEK